MEFDSKAFMRQQFQPRQEAVEVESLSRWFNKKDDEKCTWTVRGLTASELSKTLEASSRVKSIETIIKSISNSQETINELKGVIGIGTETPADIVKRLDQLVICSVDPVIELNVAVKLAETFPIEFYLITNKIVMLTGLGMDIKKPVDSGKIQLSET